MEKVRDFYIEIEVGNKSKKKIFLLISYDSGEIWIDTKALPDTAFLCSMLDGIPMLLFKVGEKENLDRNFLPMKWVINEWGGNEKLVEAIKKRKTILEKDLPELRKKYYDEYIAFKKKVKEDDL